MASPSSIRSAFSHDPEVHDFKILFGPSFNVQEADYDLLNKYVVYKVNQYRAMNIEDYSFWESIQMNSVKFEAEHFDELDNATLRVFRDYCYPHGFWIDLNLDLDKTCNTAMLEAVSAEWNNKWTLEQIEWVEERYHSLSRTTRKRKQELTGIPHLDSASNPKLNTAGQGTQQYQDMRYQTPPQQPSAEPISYPTVIKTSPYLYRPHQSQLPYKQDPHQQTPLAQAPLVQALPRQASQRQVPRIQALSVSAPLTPIPPTQQAPLTKAIPIQASLIQAPPAQVPPTQAPPVQAFSASAPSVSIKHDRGQRKSTQNQSTLRPHQTSAL
ncbi:hypothetical protein MMC31_002475 [Peltigera leucophlebia]|nr:hypothetical protein [Peltigera leucophlebia]